MQPGWYSDPYSRHEHRWFDGTGWTDHVSDRGVASQDPVPGASIGVPQQAYGPGPVSERSGFPVWGWVLIALFVVVVLVGGVVGAVLVLRDASSESADPARTEDSGRTGDELPGEDLGDEPFGGRSDASVAELRSECEAGTLSACDQLYLDTPPDSEDEAFAMTCGGRDPGGGHEGDCVITYEGDEIRQACATGDLSSCDELYWATPEGSELEAFAMTCGGRSDDEHPGTCEEAFG